MEAYSAFASVYDKLMEDIPYDEWCSFICGLLHKYGIDDGLLLELGCGTGTLTEMFAARGYDMTGIDSSEEMLQQALQKKMKNSSSSLYLCQDMREFELYGTVRAIVSLCDTMNYITNYEELVCVLKLANNYLDPHGIFIFDLKTDFYFRGIGNQSFCDADEEVSFIWDNSYDANERLNEYALTLFMREDDGIYRRFDEYHVQRAYLLSEIKKAIAEAGMEFCHAIDSNGSIAGESTERIYIIARERGKMRNSNE